MPMKLTITEGALPQGNEKQALEEITNAFLKWHGATGNAVMTRNVTGHLIILPKGKTFSGAKEVVGAWVEWVVPSFALNATELQKGFFAEATQILHDLSGGNLPKENVWADAVHAVNGAFNINGVALSNDEIGVAISA